MSPSVSWIDQHAWRHWPPPGASAASALDHGPEKRAAAAHPLTVEYVAERAVTAMVEWAPQLPAGISKVAARRDEDMEELPAVTPKNIWRHPNAHPVTLVLLLLDRYGQEYLEWDPDTLRLTLRRDGVALSNSVWTKILAGRALMVSPSPWKQWEVFHWLALGLSGRPPNFIYLEEPEIGYQVSAVDMMRLVDPNRETDLEVDKFVAATFKNEGIHYLPPPMDFAQRELEEPKLECQHCGAIHRDDNDQRCITCGSVQLKSIPYEFEGIKQQTRSLWNSRSSMPLETAVEGLLEDAAGNATYRLLVHWDYANQVRARLIQQLRAIGKR